MKVYVYLLILCVLAATLQIKADDYGIGSSGGSGGLGSFGGGYGQGYGGITGGGYGNQPSSPPLDGFHDAHGAGPFSTFCIGKGGLLAHPADCCSFIDCDHGGIEGVCSPGTVFSIISNTCDYVRNSKCLKGTNKHCAKKALKKWGR